MMNQELNEVIAHLQNQLNVLNDRQQQQLLANQPAPVEEHRNLTFNIQRAEDVSLHLFKTLPEFSGDRTMYATWRSITKTAMNLLENYKASMQYCQALMITRNKIIGAASNILNNYNTPFNFEAIIDRLDFTYADKRPMYVLEQELLVLQQRKLTIDEFFDKVNEKLNAIINKINMTHAEPATARAFINNVNEKDLRTFIKGLNNRQGEILYASNPTSLPETYARLQTIINDHERMKFANRYNKNDYHRHHFEMQPAKNPQFRFREFEKSPQKETTELEPMEVDRSSTKVHIERPNHYTPPNPMNTFVSKRNSSHQGMATSASNHRTKQQRINNMEEPTPLYTKTIIADNPADNEADETESVSSENTVSTKSSIFLGE